MGQLDEKESLFITERDPKRHYVGKHEGYGISRDVIKHLQQCDIKTVRLVIDENHYDIPLYVWTKYGVVDQLTEHDGWQIFLTWKRIRLCHAANVLDNLPKNQRTLE